MKTLKNILLITIPTLLIIFLVLEIASRLLFPGDKDPKHIWDEKNKLPKFSQEYGATGLKTTGNLAQIRAKWRINNEGWNSPVDYYSEKKEGIKRVAVIGDSYIEGFQVDIEKSFPYVLSGLMGKHFEVYSFGISGAPLSQYLQMARYVEKQYSPDIYIFNLIHNDFDESIYGIRYMPEFLTVKIENKLCKEVQPIPYEHRFVKIPLSSILKKSSFIRYLSGNLKVMDIFKTTKKEDKKAEMNVLIEDVLNNKVQLELVTGYLLETIKSELKGKKIIFIMDAPRWNIYTDELDKSQARELNFMVTKLCTRLNLTFIDLTPLMLEDYKKKNRRFESVYDGHWNTYGHEFVANILNKYLKSINQ